MAVLYTVICIASNVVLWGAFYNSILRKILSGIIAIAGTSYIIFLISSAAAINLDYTIL